ncbi:MAG: cytochrome b/b6 domain-containing protein [Coriobacteriia bacterium]|nr:cytochrome b/b6 domain-containing protein [Coriobacteriia bacterium]
MAHPLATREEHPAPARWMHFVHLLSIFVLAFTGFYIARPFFPGGMGAMRMTHFIFMFVLIVTAVVRVWWAFVGPGSAPLGRREKVRDYRHFGYQRENRGTFWGTVKYYLFLQPTAPQVYKYNSLQKGTYVFWLLLIAAQAVTGFAIWSPTQEWFLPLTYALGGSMYVRTWHYLIMWLFLITTAIHIYLSALHLDELKMMFTGREMRGAGE